ncbi:MAG TPA: FAD:protein FMN transferase [Myxococcota bacterium]|nr:FAD:protein FMN transferase [Myxococcota bacterium]
MKLYRHGWKAMGSPCEIQLFAASESEARRVSELAIADVARLEARYSRYRSDSFLSEINRTAERGGRIAVDAETASLLSYADTCFRESDGLFDITSGILRRAWRFDLGELPDAERVQELLAKVGWDKVEWRAPELEFPVAGMELDFGGVVKEYAVDRATALCRQAGIASGLVNLGGDVGVIGPRPDGSAWRIGIRHPRRPGSTLETVSLGAGALATSGDYERCIELGGVRYGHILSPKTGWPVRHLAAVSVVGELCVVAGSASTIAMLKEQDGPAWLERAAVSHLWVDVYGRAGGSLLLASSSALGARGRPRRSSRR